MVEQTRVDLIVGERGAERAANQLDRLTQKTSVLGRLAPTITRLGGSLAGLGQVARLLGDNFDALGTSISNVGIAALGLGQLGALFGPIGAAIGTIVGVGVGILNEVLGGGAAPTPAAAQGVTINNQIEMKAELNAESLAGNLREVVDQFRGPLDEVRRRTADQINDILRRDRNALTAFNIS